MQIAVDFFYLRENKMLESLPTIVIVKMLILQTIIKFYSAAILQVLEFFMGRLFEAFYSRIMDK